MRNPEGLHLRPADQLVRMAGRYRCALRIGKLDPRVVDQSRPDDSLHHLTDSGELFDCNSILSIISLGAAQGDVLTLTADGPDATTALEEISRWFETGFASDDDPAPPAATP